MSAAPMDLVFREAILTHCTPEWDSAIHCCVSLLLALFNHIDDTKQIIVRLCSTLVCELLSRRHLSVAL